MIRKYKKAIIFANLVLLLGLFNYSIFEKEEILNKGKLVLLELMPVDPRSLMQGDYMRLRYTISQDDISISPLSYDDNLTDKRGYCVVKLDSLGVAQKQRLQQGKEPLANDEILINYTKGDWGINIGAESYFFQEGQAAKFDSARFGGVKVDGEGNSILVGLYDRQRKKLE